MLVTQPSDMSEIFLSEMRCNLIYPYLHQHESDVESYGKAFRALFRDWK